MKRWEPWIIAVLVALTAYLVAIQILPHDSTPWLPRIVSPPPDSLRGEPEL